MHEIPSDVSDVLKTLAETEPWEWPQNAASTLLPFLRDRQAGAEDRLLAAELAGDYAVVDDEIVEVLLGILSENDEADALRARAAISLGPALESADTDGFDEPEACPISEAAFDNARATLQRLYGDPAIPKFVRRRILEAAVRAPMDWHADAVRAAYASGDAEWVLTAVFCMGYIKGFDKEILESLDSKDPDVEYHAVEAAGGWQLDAAWPHVAVLLKAKDTEKSLLIAAIDAAAGIDPVKAADLIEPYLHSKDEEIAEAAEEAMGLMDESWEDEEFEDAEDDTK